MGLIMKKVECKKCGMGVAGKDTFEIYLVSSREVVGSGLKLLEALRIASDLVGNESFNIAAVERTYLYGPGDGTTSVMVRRESE